MIEVHSSALISRPSAEVFEYLADMTNNPHWQRGMQSCEWTSDAPLGVGSTYDQVATFLGKEIRSSFEVTEFEPGRKIRIATTSGAMPIDVTRMVEGAGDEKCRVTAIVRGDPSGLFRIAAPLMRAMVGRSVRQDYRRLQELLEADPAPS